MLHRNQKNEDAKYFLVLRIYSISPNISKKIIILSDSRIDL